MENNRKMMDDHHGVSPLGAKNQVTTRIPAPENALKIEKIRNVLNRGLENIFCIGEGG